MARGFSVRPIPSGVKLDRLLTQTIQELRAGRPLQREEGSAMSKLAEMAERVRASRAAHTARADQLVAKAENISARGDRAIEEMEREVGKHDADVTALENELRQMTNGAE
jgi:hypothetical protein